MVSSLYDGDDFVGIGDPDAGLGDVLVVFRMKRCEDGVLILRAGEHRVEICVADLFG